jgi:hypothetical protein
MCIKDLLPVVSLIVNMVYMFSFEFQVFQINQRKFRYDAGGET